MRHLTALFLWNIATVLPGHRDISTILTGNLPAALVWQLPAVLPGHLFAALGGVLQRTGSIAAVVLSGVVVLITNGFMACRAFLLVFRAAFLLILSAALLLIIGAALPAVLSDRSTLLAVAGAALLLVGGA